MLHHRIIGRKIYDFSTLRQCAEHYQTLPEGEQAVLRWDDRTLLNSPMSPIGVHTSKLIMEAELSHYYRKFTSAVWWSLCVDYNPRYCARSLRELALKVLLDDDFTRDRIFKAKQYTHTLRLTIPPSRTYCFTNDRPDKCTSALLTQELAGISFNEVCEVCTL